MNEYFFPSIFPSPCTSDYVTKHVRKYPHTLEAFHMTHTGKERREKHENFIIVTWRTWWGRKGKSTYPIIF
jgi:hypothetical protein